MSETLTRIRNMCEVMVQLRDRIETLKTDLENAKADYRAIEQEDLPELMRECGLQSIRLNDGSTIEVVEDVSCYISESRWPEAREWLITNGFDGIIKTEVTVQFGRGEREAAEACAKSVGGAMQENVHPQTLKAFVKERLQTGANIPFDAFGIHPFNRAKIKSK